MAKFGDVDEPGVDQQKMDLDRQRALIRQEARAIADTNEAVHAKVPATTDAAAQVRIAVYGIDFPGFGASNDELIWYDMQVMSRIPSISKDEAWELNRTFLDIVEGTQRQGREEAARGRLIVFTSKLHLKISTADKNATQGLTGISALITSDRRETLNQTIRQAPLNNSPGIIDGFKNMVFKGR